MDLVFLQEAEPFSSLWLMPFFVRFTLCSVAPGGHNRQEWFGDSNVISVKISVKKAGGQQR
jgi:hypothetical protein